MASLQWKTMVKVVSLALVAQVCFSMRWDESFSTLSAADKIWKLPGQPQVGFQHFSGYVTVDQEKERALFYYFVEAEIDEASKPLVLWLNGGRFLTIFLYNMFFSWRKSLDGVLIAMCRAWLFIFGGWGIL